MYRRWWGEHVHHGYWDDPADPREPPAAAQERLTAVLAEAARLPRRATVLDVGCGFGGSARWLARNLEAHVLGWTLSRRQARFAAARRHGRPLLFVQADAETWPARPRSADAVWIVECLEHLGEKGRAFVRAAETLRPGGVLALCAWMAGPREDGRTAEVARAFLCPSLASPDDHARWARAANLVVETERDLTPFVRPTWDLCRKRLRAPWVRAAVRFVDGDTRRFVRGFGQIAAAYDEGSLAYGLLVARKPRASIVSLLAAGEICGAEVSHASSEAPGSARRPGVLGGPVI